MKNKNFSNRFWLKKVTTLALAGLVVIFILGLTLPALALQTGIEYGTITGLGVQDIRISLMKIVRVILGFVGIIALLIIIYAGFVWMTSAGNPERIDYAKRTLRNAVIGLIIILSAFAIVSFIINALLGVFGGPRPGGGGPPPECDGCGNLGAGIIESVYPVPFARDVARNTIIMVTFKVKMNPSTIIKGASSDPNDCTPTTPCEGELISDNVRIYPDAQGEDSRLQDNEVFVLSDNGRTFKFDPGVLLGNENEHIWYATKLTNDIEKDNGDPAFSNSSFGNYFSWRYEIGTFVDLDPVEQENVFPIPDNQGDDYSQTIGAQASGSLTVVRIPQVIQMASSNHQVVATIPTSPSASVSGTYGCTVDAVICLTAVNGGAGLNISAKAGPAPATPDPDFCSTASDITVPGLSANAVVSGNAAPLGCQLIFQADQSIVDGNQWYFTVTAAKQADTLRVANRTYTFVAEGQVAGVNEINVGSTVADVASNIATKINNDTQTPNVLATAAGTDVNLTAERIGEEGNNISLTASGNWANLGGLVCTDSICRLSGGSDSVLEADVNDKSDQPRNVVIKIDFNEAIDPTRINDGTVQIQYNNNSDPTAEDDWVNVEGRYFVSNQYKTAEFLPNSLCGVCQGSSSGFVGNACGSDADCGGVADSCQPLVNSCGDVLYCLPTLLDGNSSTSAYDATAYRVIVKAGLLTDCQGLPDDQAGLGTICSDPNYNQCVTTPGGNGQICANQEPYGLTDNFFYPEVRLVANGISDTANNSFNANKNVYVLGNQTLGNAQGPQEQSGQDAYNLNSPNVSSQGDDLIWSFYINKSVDLSPPIISQVGPNVSASGVSLTLPLESTFDELLFGATLKPGTGYEDGYCACEFSKNDPNDNTNPDCASNEICDDTAAAVRGIYGKCKNPVPLSQEFCAEESECPTNLCINKKYVSLIDQSTVRAGWWVTHVNLDLLPQDGYGDITKAQLQHTKLSPVSNYGGENGSGIKDVYQNCFLPSPGPTGVSGVCSLSGGSCQTDIDCPQVGERCEGVGRCSANLSILCASDLDCPAGQTCSDICLTTPAQPYCCNGQALPQRGACSADPNRSCATNADCGSAGTCSVNWEGSACFTGY